MRDKIYKMRLHRKWPTDRNPQIAIIAYWPDESGGWHRCLKHKGIDPQWSIERDMTPSEIEIADRQWRMCWVSYVTWEGLIEDEYRVTRNIAWCQEIHDLCEIGVPLERILSKILPSLPG